MSIRVYATSLLINIIDLFTFLTSVNKMIFNYLPNYADNDLRQGTVRKKREILVEPFQLIMKTALVKIIISFFF